MAEEQCESETLGQGFDRNQRRNGLTFVCGNQKDAKYKRYKLIKEGCDDVERQNMVIKMSYHCTELCIVFTLNDRMQKDVQEQSWVAWYGNLEDLEIK
jgi:hypothetical protein